MSVHKLKKKAEFKVGDTIKTNFQGVEYGAPIDSIGIIVVDDSDNENGNGRYGINFDGDPNWPDDNLRGHNLGGRLKKATGYWMRQGDFDLLYIGLPDDIDNWE